MYENQLTAKQQDQISELQNVGERLIKQNSEYSSILYEIEEKLHSIKNLREPQPETKGGIERPDSNDFISSIHDHLSDMSRLNNRLQKVLDHIRKIVG